MSADEFARMCMTLKRHGFELMQGEISDRNSVESVYERYLAEGYSVRFVYRKVLIPSIEFKLASNPLYNYSINNSWLVIINSHYKLKIAPLELQIAYKLYLGNGKDLGDAVFLYELFKQVLENSELEKWARILGVKTTILHGRV